ncbi:hypothetical protein PMI42_00422 [Bradyrhizobium sp. YR681]|uniref:hypothetical protein n=1 Tax=Bradyrhizobium sp. YR681 TaxID=1144344 RepID=UPI00027129F1|nr:hypothetical protein [Bradyrhizobium sp. YR681]EJN16024.1 hypothetical protein PMI42_00422 [Bradyrhizobium sp. YR681]
MNSQTIRIEATQGTADWINSSYQAYCRAMAERKSPILPCPDELKPVCRDDGDDRLWVISPVNPSYGHIIDWETMIGLEGYERRVVSWLLLFWIPTFVLLPFFAIREIWIFVLAFCGTVGIGFVALWFALSPKRRVLASLTKVEFPIELTEAIKRTSRRKRVFSIAGQLVGAAGGMAAGSAVRWGGGGDSAAKVAEELSKKVLELGGEATAEKLVHHHDPSRSQGEPT